MYKDGNIVTVQSISSSSCVAEYVILWKHLPVNRYKNVSYGESIFLSIRTMMCGFSRKCPCQYLQGCVMLCKYFNVYRCNNVWYCENNFLQNVRWWVTLCNYHIVNLFKYVWYCEPFSLSFCNRMCDITKVLSRLYTKEMYIYVCVCVLSFDDRAYLSSF